MELKIGTLAIERFRALRDLKIEGLGRVNLITGRNNTGKSSVLEALRILASGASPNVISSILHYREEDTEESEDPARGMEGEAFSMISGLFSGFPSLDKLGGPIAISANGSGGSQRLAMSVGRFAEQQDPDGTRRLVPEQAGLFPETELLPALVVELKGGRRVLPLGNLRRPSRRQSIIDAMMNLASPCVFLSPYGSEHTGTFGALWDKIALSDREKDVVEALRIMAPDIVALSMIGDPRGTRIAIARCQSISRPVPLRSLGDGVNRLFGIVVSMGNAAGGLLLIDEIENGMHHSVQLDVWRAIFRLSRRLDVQVFATSHSWDSVESFQKAASEDPEEGVLIRLSRMGDSLVPTVFHEDELAIVTRDHIEVR